MSEQTEIGQTRREVVETTIYLKTEGEIGKNLYALYEKIFLEACYDATTEETKKFAQKLLPHIRELNDILRFMI